MKSKRKEIYLTSLKFIIIKFSFKAFLLYALIAHNYQRSRSLITNGLLSILLPTIVLITKGLWSPYSKNFLTRC